MVRRAPVQKRLPNARMARSVWTQLQSHVHTNQPTRFHGTISTCTPKELHFRVRARTRIKVPRLACIGASYDETTTRAYTGKE